MLYINRSLAISKAAVAAQGNVHAVLSRWAEENEGGRMLAESAESRRRLHTENAQTSTSASPNSLPLSLYYY